MSFFIPGVPPVSFLDECQFLLREGSSGDIFSNEMPVVTEVSCIQSMKRQVSIVRGCSSSVAKQGNLRRCSVAEIWIFRLYFCRQPYAF